VDCVVAGNDWLRDAAVAQGAHAVTLEVAEDTARIKLRPLRTDGPSVTIGWLGSPSTVKYLWIIAPVLQELAKRYPSVQFELMGGGDFAMPGVPWQLYDWSLSDELEALRRFDIGLMPLPDELWSNGKSGGKARTYMAAGVVPVCTAIGYNLELVDDGVTGFLCRTDEEWLEKLCRLIDEPDLRCAMARAARADVEARFAPARQAAALHALLVEHARGDAGSFGQQEAA
jgi:glycosyltransferase involved in cell wall biosynthesis